MIPDYLPSAGVDCSTQEELISFCHRVVQNGRAIEVPDSDLRLIRWGMGEGLHVWMYVTPSNEVVSMFPFHYSASGHEIKIEQLLYGEDEANASIQVEGWVVNPSGQETRRTDGNTSFPASESRQNSSESNLQYKISFLCIDAPLYEEELQGENLRSFQLQVMCRKPKLHLNDGEFEEEQREWGAENEVQAGTVLSGHMLNIQGHTVVEGAEKQPFAYIAGRVVESNVRKNSVTGNQFFHVSLWTRGGTLDAFLAEQVLPASPEPGNIVEGYFLLLGMRKPRRA